MAGFTKHIGTYQMLRKKGVKPFDLDYHVQKVIETLSKQEVNYNTLFQNGFMEHIFDKIHYEMRMKEFEDNFIAERDKENNVTMKNNIEL